ncbi:hypothetical protein DLM78_09645 [Leptospira stimsonii]|uniref:Uncharacterized protein n=1 Tax=Leptospira stimsonii TaxID=2202203 RepID=A0A8B3CPK1_9LEPT|nr:hypothetical protein DLM78_09645 [Leptospira stimsonii]
MFLSIGLRFFGKSSSTPVLSLLGIFGKNFPSFIGPFDFCQGVPTFQALTVKPRKRRSSYFSKLSL